MSGTKSEVKKNRVHQLTTYGGNQTPAWSPNASKIAFSRLEQDGSSNIWIIKADGSGERRVTNLTAPKYARVPSWSPDGKKIAYELQPELSVFIINLDGTDNTLFIKDAVSPIWSPDGSKIAFMRPMRDAGGSVVGYNLFVMELDSANQRALTWHKQASGLGASWSPDCSEIAYSVWDQSIGYQVRIVKSNGTYDRALTTGAYPSWSPDGSRIAFSRYDPNGNMWGIYLINPDGTHELKLIDNALWPSWSPENRKIVYQTYSPYGFLKILTIPIPKVLAKKPFKVREEKMVVGEVINFRGLVYAPVNELGVIYLFSKVANELGIKIEGMRTKFPDALGVKYGERGVGKKIDIEFEFRSSDFKKHKHPLERCDLIVCWEHDWKECPIEVIELKEVIHHRKGE